LGSFTKGKNGRKRLCALSKNTIGAKQGDGSLFDNPLLPLARYTITGMIFMPGETKRTSNSKIKKNVRGIQQKNICR